MTTILIKKKDTAGAPAAGDLTNAAGGAEIAVNTATKRIYSKDSGGAVIEMGTFPSSMAVQGALSATGNVTLGDASADSVTVNGTITSNLIFTDATYDIGASGANRPRDLFLSRNLTVGGTLTLAGGVNLNGNVTVGDSSSDTLTINSTVTSNLIFTDNTYDIGASGATRPRNVYIANTLTVGSTTTLGGAVNLGTTVGNAITFNGTITSNLVFTDNTYDIGASGATRPRNLFLGGYINATGSSSNVMAGLTVQGGGFTSAGINTLTRATITPLDFAPTDDATVAWRLGTTSVAQGAGAFDIQTSGTGSVNGQILTISRTTGKANWNYDSTISGLTVGRGGGSVSTNTVLGTGALAGSPGGNVVAIGYQAASGATGGGNIYVGRQAGRLHSGDYSTMIGDQAGYGATSGIRNVFIGAAVGYGTITGNYNIGIGGYDGSGNSVFTASLSGAKNIAIGNAALPSLTSGSSNVVIGYQAGYQTTTNSQNILIGDSAGYYGNRSGDISIGTSAGVGNSSYSGSTNTCIGTASGSALTSGYGNMFLGYYSGANVTSGYYNVIIGRYSGNTGTLDMSTANSYVAISDGAANLKAWWNGSANFFTQGSIYLRGTTGQSSGGAINYTGNWVDGGTNSGVAEWRLSRYNSSDYRWTLSGSGVNGEVMLLSGYQGWQSTDTFRQSFQFGAFAGGYFCPGVDNYSSLGTSGNRWTVVYATTGTINTSDRNQKQDIQDLSAAELAVATEIKTLFKSFRWKDAVAEKGDAARIHVGVIAQDVQDAFAKHGLDAARYALWCEDVHYELDGKYADKIGVKYTAETEGAVRVTKLGVRYDQLLAFVIAAM
jgi:hypothetical protein